MPRLAPLAGNSSRKRQLFVYKLNLLTVLEASDSGAHRRGAENPVGRKILSQSCDCPAPSILRPPSPSFTLWSCPAAPPHPRRSPDTAQRQEVSLSLRPLSACTNRAGL